MNFSKKITGYALASFILGLIGFITIWLIFVTFIGKYFIIFPFIHGPIGILAIIFGSVGYFKNGHFALCLTGFILGLLTGIVGLIAFLVKLRFIF